MIKKTAFNLLLENKSNHIFCRYRKYNESAHTACLTNTSANPIQTSLPSGSTLSAMRFQTHTSQYDVTDSLQVSMGFLVLSILFSLHRWCQWQALNWFHKFCSHYYMLVFVDLLCGLDLWHKVSPSSVSQFNVCACFITIFTVYFPVFTLELAWFQIFIQPQLIWHGLSSD